MRSALCGLLIASRRNYAAGAVRNRLKGAGEGEREAQETGGTLLLQA
jgi:hypothetical protein